MATKAQFDITARDKTKRAFRSVEQSIGGMTKKVVGFGIASFSVFSGINSILRQMTRSADILNMSRTLGASTEFLTGLEFVAQQANANVAGIELALQRMVRNFEDAAQGQGEAVKAFERLGFSRGELTKLAGAGAQSQLFAILDRFERIRGTPTEQAGKRLSIGRRIFESEGIREILKLGTIADVLKGLEAAEGAGRVKTEAELQKAAKADAALNRVRQAKDEAARKLAVGAAETVTKVADAVANTLNDPVGTVSRDVGALNAEMQRSAVATNADLSASLGRMVDAFMEWLNGDSDQAKTLQAIERNTRGSGAVAQ